MVTGHGHAIWRQEEEEDEREETMHARGGQGGTKTGSSTSGGGTIFHAAPSPARIFQGSLGGYKSGG